MPEGGACRVLGVDLAGPANAADTAAVVALAEGGRLRVEQIATGLDDHGLWALAESLTEPPLAVVGLDAPLSYQSGGGDRPGDRELRQALRARGLPAGTVMPPTLTRMAYLTLRGLAVTRMLLALNPALRICEVHPSGVLSLRGADSKTLTALKQSSEARLRLLESLEAAGLAGSASLPATSDHLVAAAAAALGTACWALGRPLWCWPAEPPWHPHDYVC